MNRNTELHFGTTPAIDLKRSKFDKSHSHKTSFNAGDLIPVYVDSDILPGDTVQMDMAELVRMATPIYPIMDNMYLDTYAFFVPHRLTWEHWAEFWGENDDPWTQQIEYEIPQIDAPTGGWTEGTIADYMGVPTKVENFSLNALPFRAYVKCWNDYFRDENLKSAAHMYNDDTTRTGQTGAETGYTYVTGAEFGGKPLKIAKFHGYYTSCLPEPQKGPDVKIPLGSTAPVLGADHSFTGYPTDTNLVGDHIGWIYAGSNTGRPYGVAPDGTEHSMAGNTSISLVTNLADATAATINELRTAFAIQKYYENAALHGTRYIEWIKGVFGVTSSDGRLQRAEYLGGSRVPLNVDQILQTSSTDNTSPQGNTAGFSCTINKDSMFTKSFEEHGTLLILAAVRTDRTYQQGLSKMWTRKKWHDFYNPFFANLGNTDVKNKNIYLQGTNVVDTDGKIIDDKVFGYQEAWAEYRYAESYLSGYMRSNATGSLDAWHFADDYSSLPYLSSDWIDEPKDTVDRTIAVSSQLTHQFIGDFFFKTFYTRCMPVYSVPGLIDHV